MTIDAEAIKILAKAKDERDVQKIINNREKVLGEFGSLFQHETVGKISKSDFQQFLSFKSNKHWTGLERQKNRLCEDMEALRHSLTSLLDESLPLSERIDRAIQLRGMGPAILTAILLVSDPQKYGVWNGTSAKGIVALGLWPEVERGETDGQIYAKLNSTLVEVASQLEVDLWTLDALWWGVSLSGTNMPAKKPKSKTNSVREFDAREKAVWEIVNTVVSTVQNSNGQIAQTTQKNKELRMSKIELENLVKDLFDAQRNRCAISDLSLQFEGKDLNFRPSLDRIDSDGHYERGNLQLVCRFINFWKSDKSDEEFRRLIAIVRGEIPQQITSP